MQARAASTQGEPATEPVGIGGWLILPLIGIVVTPVTGLMQIGAYAGFGESWQYLSTAQKTFVFAEGLGVLVTSVIFPIVLLVLLFRKRRAFPGAFVAWAIVNFLFLVIDLVGANMLFGELFERQGMEFFDDETIRSIVRAVAMVVVWTPYMMNSRRVKNTFVN